MMNMANQHIVQRGTQRWVLGEGNSRTSGNYDTQFQAIQQGKEIATNQWGDVIIHWRDGKIRERNTYGKQDFFPPKG